MNNKLLNCLIAGALSCDACACVTACSLAVAVAVAAVAVMAWWRHAWRDGMEVECISAAWVGGMRAGGASFAGSRVASGSRVRGQPLRGCAFCACRVCHHGRFFHHRLHRFAFVGAPYAYAA